MEPPLSRSSTVLLLATIWICFWIHRRIQWINRLSHLPGPPTVSHIWGDTFDLRKLRVGTIYREWREKYGPTYIIREPFMEPVLMLGDPKGISHVLNHTAIYWRPFIDRNVMVLWFGESLFCSETTAHAFRRKRLSPAFAPQAIKEISHVFFSIAYRLKADWEDRIGSDDSMTIDVSKDLHTLAMNAITMSMFAHDLSVHSGEDSVAELLIKITNGPPEDDTYLTRIASIAVGMWPELLSLPSSMKQWADVLRAELGKIAKEAWDVCETNERVGDMDAKAIEVLRRTYKGQQVASRDDAVSEITGLLFAGSETITNVMGELLLELAVQPVIQNRLRDELISFEVRHNREPEYGDLINPSKSGLGYLEAVMMETLRCKAVLMTMAREVMSEDVIPLKAPLPNGDTFVRVLPGQFIAILMRDGVNIDPIVWGPDAHIFRPDRWFEEGVGEGGPGPGGILTFGDGGKTCIGRAFALAEFKAVISILVRHFSFHLAEACEQIDFYHMGGDTVKPKVRGREDEGVMLPLRVERVL